MTWSVTSNLQITGGQGTGTVFIKATGTGMGELTALISSGCESIQFTRDIEIVNGVPDFTKLDAKNIDGYRNLKACEITEAEAIYTGSGPILRYEWDIPFSSSWSINPMTSWPPYRMVEIDYYEDPAPSTEDLSLRAKNVCGWSAWKGNPWSVTDNCSARTVDNDSIEVYEQPVKDTDEEEILSLSLYPTIANDVIIIAGTGRYDKPLSVDIYNSQGRKVKTFERLNSSHIQLLVDDLPTGLFFAILGELTFSGPRNSSYPGDSCTPYPMPMNRIRSTKVALVTNT